MASKVFAGHQSESVVSVCMRGCKPLIIRTQLRIKKVNKVMSLRPKSVTHNRALALLDDHNHRPLVPQPVTQLFCSVFPEQNKPLVGGVE